MTGELDRLRDLVLEDRALALELWQMTDATAFIARVVDLAHDRGLRVTQEELWNAYHEGKAAWLAIWAP